MLEQKGKLCNRMKGSSRCNKKICRRDSDQPGGCPVALEDNCIAGLDLNKVVAKYIPYLSNVTKKKIRSFI